MSESPIQNEIEPKMDQSSEEEQQSQSKVERMPKRIGIIGYGHLGQFLKMELSKSTEFTLKRIWNRIEDPNEGVLPLGELNAANLADIDLVIEVAHPDVIHSYGTIILEHADLFIGSSSALANEKSYKEIQNCLKLHNGRSVFVPSGALWGAKNIQEMAILSILKELTITMILHPNSLRLPELFADSPPELVVLHKFCKDSKETNYPKVLYDGPIRQICLLAPNNANSIASAAIAAQNLGFDNTRAKLIVDPELRNWQIIEYMAIGENGFRTVVRRENPAQHGMANNSTTYFSFLASIKDALYSKPGFNIC